MLIGTSVATTTLSFAALSAAEAETPGTVLVIAGVSVASKPAIFDDKVPLGVVYPYSERAGVQKELSFWRSVRPLNGLTVP
jgi:hypothetical protein